MKTMQFSAKKIARSLLIVSCASVLAALFAPGPATAQEVDPSLYSGLKWRMIGPFRGGRAVAVTGVPGQPSHFYFGSVGGGVWESFNAGETWTPIFDSEDVQSIGAIAVAPSNPSVIYVGTGEADMRSQISYGKGMYKSTDGGKTWTHIGLEDTRQIGRVLVDPQNPDTVFVAALGHAYGPNAERGVFRSTDGGRTWQKVLFKDENVGAIDLAFDPQNSKTIYATLWAARRPPWSIYPPANGPGAGVFKSTDGGGNWQQLTGGLPSEGVGRIGVAVAPSNSQRVYAIVDAKKGGLYRSDDAGATWTLMNEEQRIWGRGWYFENVVVDPKDPDKVYVSNTSVYRSDDGGKTVTAVKGAPGGDDYHQLWIEPEDGSRMILASDQGVEVSVDGAKSWSSWYNQPTAQIYHIVTDDRDPYWVYGAQQDSGAVSVETRSTQGSITYLRGWDTICAGGESGYVAVDPADSDVLYGGTVSKCRQSTNVGEQISPMLGYAELGPFRHTWTLPLVFSQAGAHALYFSNQYVWKTANGGGSWQRISEDLTRDNPGVPPNLDAATAADAFAGPRQGVVYTIAPSPLEAATIWAGTDDGLIHVTHNDGKTWENVTPPELTGWSKVALIDASHFNAAAAYAAVDRHRLEDYKPYIYRTRDGGKTWKLITAGIPEGSYVNAVKEDPGRKGLLFAGTELGVYVSFDDGDHWQSLQLNLPRSSARDFAIHNDDLIVATHGRGFWVLDDISALRQTKAEMSDAPATLFKPKTALRMRAGGGGGTPLPYGSPEAENPPNGAIIDYYLKASASGPVTLEILDSAGKSVRKYSSEDRAPRVNPQTLNIPAYWVHPAETLSAEAGMHRWVWDVRYASVGGGGGRGGGGGFFGGGGGLWVLPGAYTVKLTVNGQTYAQPLEVKMDPHVKTATLALQRQFEVAQQVQEKQAAVNHARQEVAHVRDQIGALKKQAGGNVQLVSALDALDKKTAEVGGVQAVASPDSSGVGEPSSDFSSLLFLNGELGQISGAIEGADSAPGEQVLHAWQVTQKKADTALGKWNAVKSGDLAAVNTQLKQANLPEISTEAPAGGRGGRGGRSGE
jgi:photosystem II stability/assembly factor-like uncharacterized protein